MLFVEWGCNGSLQALACVMVSVLLDDWKTSLSSNDCKVTMLYFVFVGLLFFFFFFLSSFLSSLERGRGVLPDFLHMWRCDRSGTYDMVENGAVGASGKIYVGCFPMSPDGSTDCVSHGFV